MEKYTDEWYASEKKNIQRLERESIEKMENIFQMVEDKNVWDNLTQGKKDDYQVIKKQFSDLKKKILTSSIGKKSEGESSNSEIVAKSPNELVPKYLIDGLRLVAVCQEIADLKEECEEDDEVESESDSEESIDESVSCLYDPNYLTEEEADTMCIISHFLFARPSGASLGNIDSFVKKTVLNMNAEEIETFMRRFPEVFQENEVENETKWFYVGGSVNASRIE